MSPSLLYDQIAMQDAWEWIGLITGIAYVLLATYERPSCWIFGIISSGCIAWKSFTDYKLIADGGLQIFYICIGVIGLWQWMEGRVEKKQKPIIISAAWSHIKSILICLALSWPVSWILIHYAHANYGFVDTLLTLLSIWATMLLIRKDLHNWLYWIVIDIVYVGLYWKSEGYLFALLFFIYAGISVWGWRRWRQRQLTFSLSHE